MLIANFSVLSGVIVIRLLRQRVDFSFREILIEKKQLKRTFNGCSKFDEENETDGQAKGKNVYFR